MWVVVTRSHLHTLILRNPAHRRGWQGSLLPGRGSALHRRFDGGPARRRGWFAFGRGKNKAGRLEAGFEVTGSALLPLWGEVPRPEGRFQMRALV